MYGICVFVCQVTGSQETEQCYKYISIYAFNGENKPVSFFFMRTFISWNSIDNFNRYYRVEYVNDFAFYG